MSAPPVHLGYRGLLIGRPQPVMTSNVRAARQRQQESAAGSG